jgi:hypothetical protein
VQESSQGFRNSSGSLVKLAAIRRTSSLLSSLATAVDHDKAGLQFFDGPGRREAVLRTLSRIIDQYGYSFLLASNLDWALRTMAQLRGSVL